MSAIDPEAPLRFLRMAFEPDDWIAVFLKSYDSGRVTQRVGPLSWIMHPRFQAWLRHRNAQRFNVYVSVNAIKAGSRERTRQAIAAIRHVFLEADHAGPAVLAAVRSRRDLPPPSYVLHSSPNRLHIFWRVDGFTVDVIEALQKQLARELGTDSAATPTSQTTRLPGFFNHKYMPAHWITAEYSAEPCVNQPSDFPIVAPVHPHVSQHVCVGRASSLSPTERARRYLARVPPAVAGNHGDLHTFRVCCRLVRGFALSDEEAMRVLTEWNVMCQPPWSERELADKIVRARRYGHEPVAGLLEVERVLQR